VTDVATMREVQEAVGTLRDGIEAQLSMGTPSSPLAGARIRVASGNFVVARPLGVVDGVDYQHTGVVRRIDAEGMKQRLDAGAIVLLSPIGYSVTGEVFNLSAHDVAASSAVALRADKLVALVEGRVTDARRRLVREMTLDDAEALSRKMKGKDDLSRHLAAAVTACRGGVHRAHLVDRKVDGGLLLELFTRDGVGTLVTGETFEGIRAATLADVPTLLELIEPLARDGTLIARPRELLENEIDKFTVVERDRLVIGCAALHPFPEQGIAEIACVAVRPEYREGGRGEVLLTFLEKKARERGIPRVFVLTTRAIHWFRERGYEPAKLSALPKSRRAKVDRKRKSKVLVKDLSPG
jgi:amino-acid N-acetyltransferase